MTMMYRMAWLTVLAILVLVAPLHAQGDYKLDPEATALATPGFDENNLSQYTEDMLVAYLDVFQITSGNDAARKSAKITSYLQSIDPNWGKPPPEPTPAAPTTKARTRLKKTASGKGGDTPEPTKAPEATTPPAPTTPPSVADAPPPTLAPPPSTPVPTVIPTGTWDDVAAQQMRSFWDAGGDQAGDVPRNMIYDPLTRKLVKISDHIGEVGVHQDFADELANTASGRGAREFKRITDK